MSVLLSKCVYSFLCVENPVNPKFHGKISAFICVYLRLISVFLRYLTKEIQFEVFQHIGENNSVPVPGGIVRRQG
ncbi:MAG: hypothetical protein CVV36_02110 [Candidatus Methanoperedenaceae archaeon HGW-Methanoperedenaceae-1]|jgi:hypothetical protein|nr:MAG: hypothetical protein CVV36_02110 [Candidatus Methanoperedenaceae archaeon HGW-Methanoperedenaceae-1]